MLQRRARVAGLDCGFGVGAGIGHVSEAVRRSDRRKDARRGWPQKPCPQSVQKRAWRGIVAPQPGQLLCVLAMSKPHSWQKRPPCDGVWQFGHADRRGPRPRRPLLQPSPVAFSHLMHSSLDSTQQLSHTLVRQLLHDVVALLRERQRLLERRRLRLAAAELCGRRRSRGRP